MVRSVEVVVVDDGIFVGECGDTFLERCGKDSGEIPEERKGEKHAWWIW